MALVTLVTPVLVTQATLVLVVFVTLVLVTLATLACVCGLYGHGVCERLRRWRFCA